MTIEGGDLACDAHCDNLHIVKTGRIALFLAAEFARVAILLSGVPHCTPPLILATAFSPHQQSPSMVFRLVVKPIESS